MFCSLMQISDSRTTSSTLWSNLGTLIMPDCQISGQLDFCTLCEGKCHSYNFKALTAVIVIVLYDSWSVTLIIHSLLWITFMDLSWIHLRCLNSAQDPAAPSPYLSGQRDPKNLETLRGKMSFQAFWSISEIMRKPNRMMLTLLQ